MSLSHHLAAVWFADVVGYTRLSEENEGEAVRLVHGFQRVAREVVTRYGGRIVKFLGDGALAEFSSTDMAVRSAEDLIRAFASVAESEGLASDALRIGVHVGDVVATEDGDLYGDGVNVASRIQAAGDPGEVWVSEDVRRQLRQRPEFRFESRGERELKGLSRPLAMHAVQVLDVATWTPPEAERQPAGAPRVTGKRNGAPGAGSGAAGEGRWSHRRAVSLLGAGILIAIAAIGASTWFLGRGSDAAGSETVLAVLPFENLSGDEATEPFVLGVHDDLLSQLSRLGTFKVISNTTMMGYEGSTKSVPEIAEELGATTVLEGGVQRSGDRIRMNVQLIDARTDEHLWAERYDRTLTAGDVFAIQAEIAEQIAGALATALTPEQKADIARTPTENLEALDLYYEGLAFYRGRAGFGFESSRRAEATLAAAVAADPDFAAAWAALAQARAWQLRNGVATDTTAARQALDRAIALAPESRETTVAEGVYLYYAKADFAGADERFQGALERWPEDADLLAWRSLVVRRRGRWKEALELEEKARAMDPRNPDVLISLGETLEFLRRLEEAERAWDQVLALNPDDQSALFYKVDVLLSQGDAARAGRFLETSSDLMSAAGRARYHAMVSFYERDFEAGIAALEGQPVEPALPTDAPYWLALLSRWAGREAATRAWADSLEATAQRKIDELEAAPLDPFVQRAWNVALRGVARALSGRIEEAKRDARLAMDLLPVSQDAVDAVRFRPDVALIYVLIGDSDAAFKVLDELASIPSLLSAGDLRTSPVYDSLRDDPRYPELLEKLEAAERSDTGTR